MPAEVTYCTLSVAYLVAEAFKLLVPSILRHTCFDVDRCFTFIAWLWYLIYMFLAYYYCYFVVHVGKWPVIILDHLFTSFCEILYISLQLHQLPARLQNICTQHVKEMKNCKENYDE
jgi:hypothetical protein